MTEDVRGYLQSKGLHVKQATGFEVHTSCMFCNEPPERRGRLYVNTETGLYFCQKCGEKGNLFLLKQHFGDTVNRDDESFHQHSLILQEAALFYHDKLADHADVLRYLTTERGLTLDTIENHLLGYAAGGLKQHLRSLGYDPKDVQGTGLVGATGDFLMNRITIPYLVQNSVVMIRGRDFTGADSRKYITPPGQKARLFNTDVLWSAPEAVICEGEFDALVLSQLGIAVAAVPGAASWQDSWNGYFADCRRTWIAFDTDPAGTAGAGKVMEHLGAKARLITLPDINNQHIDLTDWIVTYGAGLEQWQELTKRSSGGLLATVDDAHENWSVMQGLPGVQLGIPRIDAMMRPGIQPSQLFVYLARTGVGKTVLMINLFHLMAMTQPDLRFLFVSLEQTRGDWFERARRIWRFWNPDSNDAECRDFWRKRLMIVDENRVTEDQLEACIEDYQYEMGVKPHVVGVDYLGYWSNSFKGERYERTSDAVMALKAMAKRQMVSMFVPHQVNRAGSDGCPDLKDARDSGVIEETADFLAGLWSLPADREQGILNFKVRKSRHGGVDTTAAMRFGPLTLAISPDLSSKQGTMLFNEVAWVKDNMTSANNGANLKHTWEDAVRYHYKNENRGTE